VTRILGIVNWINASNPGQPFAGVLPLVDDKWNAIAPSTFPPEGQAFWPLARDAQKESLVFFEVEENFGHRGNDKEKDKYRVRTAELATEVIDLRSVGDVERVRRRLALGIRLAAIPHRAMIWCQSDIVVGPVQFTLGANGLVTLDRATRASIPYCGAAELDIRTELRTGRSVLVGILPSPSGFVDWDEDRMVVQRAFQAALKHGVRSDDVAFAQQILDDAAATVTETGLTAEEIELEVSRLTRARELLAAHERVDILSQSTLEAFQQHPLVQKQLQAATRAAEVAVRAEVLQDMEEQVERVAHLRRDAAAAEAQISTAIAELSSVRDEREEEVARIEKEVRERVRAELEESSPRAEIAVPRTQSKELSIQATGDAWSHTPIHPAWRARPDAIADLNQLRRRAVSVFKAKRVASTVFQQFHASLSARLFPILGGDAPMNAVEAYANTTCSGRLVVIHASALLQEAADVFGRIDSSGGRLVPHPAGLIDLVIAAQLSDAPALVVLEGVNRGPTESFLVPLVRSWVEMTALPLFHPNALRPADKYRGAMSLRWPTNIFLCGTLSEGPTTLPVSPDIWPYASFIESSVEPGDSNTVEDPSEASLTGDVFRLEEPEDEELGADFQGLLAPLSRSTIRYARALRRFTSDEKAILPIVAKVICAPFVACQPEGGAAVMQQFVEQTGVEMDMLAEAVARVRRRIG
jgi:hypothetical protein